MRVLLLTGKGGVGTTTAAAATAAAVARRGRKVLVLSADPAHSLADALGVPVGAEPTEVAPGLSAMQVDRQAGLERSWRALQHSVRGALERAGLDGLQAEQLTVLPGADELLALLALSEQVSSGPWDLVVVDCPATGETLRLLALPEALSRYAEQAFPARRRALQAARPLLSRVAGPAVPPEDLFEAVGRLQAELLELRQVLTAPETCVRLVLTPEAVVVAEARRTLTSLALYGYRVDALVVNRVFAATGDPFLDGWVRAQAEQLAVIRAGAGRLPVHELAYQAAEPVGVEVLAALGEALYGGDDPAADGPEVEPLSVERTVDGFALSLPLPLARAGELDLIRTGDDLVVTVSGHRRVLSLPSALRRCTVVGAALREGRLQVRFEPDPELWMRP